MSNDQPIGDEVINCYLELLTKSCESFAFTTFFYLKLKEKRIQGAFTKVIYARNSFAMGADKWELRILVSKKIELILKVYYLMGVITIFTKFATIHMRP